MHTSTMFEPGLNSIPQTQASSSLLVTESPPFSSTRPTNPLICGSSSMIRIRGGVKSDTPGPGQAGLDDAGLCRGVREPPVRESPVLQASRAAVIAPSIVPRIGRTAKLKASGMRAFPRRKALQRALGMWSTPAASTSQGIKTKEPKGRITFTPPAATAPHQRPVRRPAPACMHCIVTRSRPATGTARGNRTRDRSGLRPLQAVEYPVLGAGCRVDRRNRDARRQAGQGSGLVANLLGRASLLHPRHRAQCADGLAADCGRGEQLVRYVAVHVGPAQHDEVQLRLA